MQIGDQIQRIRSMKGITQEELAEQCGLDLNSLIEYESNQRIPEHPIVKDIAKCLQVSSGYLIGISSDPTPPGVVKKVVAPSAPENSEGSAESSKPPKSPSPKLTKPKKATKPIKAPISKKELKDAFIDHKTQPSDKMVDEMRKYIEFLLEQDKQ